MTPAPHVCTVSETYAGGEIGRCPCGEWWMIAPPQYRTMLLVRSKLRERLSRYRLDIKFGEARDLQDAVRQAAARAATARAAEHETAREKWLAQQKTKEAKWLRTVRLIIIADPCAYCGAAATEIDHILPRARGGGDERRNLAPACKPCNIAKKNRTPEEWQADRIRRGASWPPRRAGKYLRVAPPSLCARAYNFHARKPGVHGARIPARISAEPGHPCGRWPGSG